MKYDYCLKFADCIVRGFDFQPSRRREIRAPCLLFGDKNMGRLSAFFERNIQKDVIDSNVVVIA
jgi:hypothetical protein